MNLKYLIIAGIMLFSSVSLSQSISIYRSKKSVDETTQALISLIREKGLVFVDSVTYQTQAVEQDSSIYKAKVVLFEDNELFSALISCQQTTILDMPLKILVWEEYEDVYIGFISPYDMEKRFMLNDCQNTIEALSRLMIRIVTDLIREM